MKELLLSVLLAVILISCQTDTYKDSIIDQLSKTEAFAISDFDSIMIIPRVGCNSCTREADAIYRDLKNHDRILFIFTNLQSIKLLKIQNGWDVCHRKNVVIDSINSFYYSNHEESQYPGLIVINDNKVDFKYLLDSVGR